ncbi:YncE family protein [Mangrovimonas sp. DI 80]|uniref:YncE family protein n=1 Tax=Mangrovimonas sp. DI 80 TaxID=1779330 RepID=UPI0009781FA7|nr:DUF5074 domain-containing protein [Mangrovimonas sp. DI 80]OMP31261.1 hypothetical protein BKM32_09410 [Mangrovimonas sp. DI 80]
MKNIFQFLALSLSVGLFLTSCSSDNDDSVTLPIEEGQYENGILVLAEGGSLSGSVSFVANDYSYSENSIFYGVNSEELGVYVQSMGFHDGKGYIVTDNNTINVVDRFTFEKDVTITSGLSLPRFIAFANGKGYVTNWGDGFIGDDDFVAVIDLATNSVETMIPVGEGPEQIIAVGDKLFVTHKGGYSINNIVSVIDTADNSVETIEVYDTPDEILMSDSGDLIVLSEGATIYDENWAVVGYTQGAITRIDPSNNTVVFEIPFEEGNSPNLMSYANGTIYFQMGGQIFEMSENDTALPTTAIVDITAMSPYGFNVKDGMAYITDAKDFASLSDLLIYDLATGNLTNTIEVGLAASKVYFN